MIAGLWSAIGFVGMVMGTGCFGPGGLSGHLFQTDCSLIYRALVVVMALPYFLMGLVLRSIESWDAIVFMFSGFVFSLILSFLLVNLISFFWAKKK